MMLIICIRLLFLQWSLFPLGVCEQRGAVSLPQWQRKGLHANMATLGTQSYGMKTLLWPSEERVLVNLVNLEILIQIFLKRDLVKTGSGMSRGWKLIHKRKPPMATLSLTSYACGRLGQLLCPPSYPDIWQDSRGSHPCCGVGRNSKAKVIGSQWGISLERLMDRL